MLLARFLKPLVKVGALTVVDADNRTHTFAGAPGPQVTVRIHSKALQRRYFFQPSMATGEGYMEGQLTVENGGTIYDLLDLTCMNMGHKKAVTPFHALTRQAARLFRRVRQFNPISRAQTNVAHHYDLSGALYDLFLDSDRQYSCAYFEPGIDDLESAQTEKKRHIAAKLLLEPGMRVLEIGSGWGGLALSLARETGVCVTGLTLSQEQLKISRERAKRAGLADRVEFHLRDYREETGVYDRIVSVGMFEHVGINHFGRYFAQVRDRLKPDGIALLHTIGRIEGPGATDPWIRKYIFPGGYIPALSEMARPIEDSGLWITDVEVLRLHYATTLRHWRERFVANWDRAKALYDERFCRMWEFYLAASEASFRHLGNVVFQVQLANRQDAVPLTRDYIDDAHRRLKREQNPDRNRAA